MNAKKRPFILVMIAFFIMISFVVFDRWLIKQIDQIQEEPSTAEKVESVIVLSEEANRYGKPVIDPDNDPLAPMVKNASPGDERIQPASTSSDNEKIYEFPQSSSPILIQ